MPASTELCAKGISPKADVDSAKNPIPPAWSG